MKCLADLPPSKSWIWSGSNPHNRRYPTQTASQVSQRACIHYKKLAKWVRVASTSSPRNASLNKQLASFVSRSSLESNLLEWFSFWSPPHMILHSRMLVGERDVYRDWWIGFVSWSRANSTTSPLSVYLSVHDSFFLHLPHKDLLDGTNSEWVQIHQGPFQKEPTNQPRKEGRTVSCVLRWWDGLYLWHLLGYYWPNRLGRVLVAARV